MIYIDLFSGIGGFALGAYWSGIRFEKHYFSEFDKYCVELYQKRFPEAIPLGDIAKIKDMPKGDYLISGGFPCQPFSVAGKQKGEKDERNLWPEMLRVIRLCKPSWVVCENVPGSIRYIKKVVKSNLENEGYEVWPFSIRASTLGAPHIRNRIWIVAHINTLREPQQKRTIEKIRGRINNSDKDLADGNCKRDREKKNEIQPGGYTPKRSGKIMADYVGERFKKSQGGSQAEGVERNRSINGADWKNVEYVYCHDGYFRPVKPGVHLLDDGVPGGVGRLTGYGNAVVPQIAELLLRQIKDLI